MTNYPRLLIVFPVLLVLNVTYGQTKSNDLYLSNLKGKVKSVSATTVHFDSTHLFFGYAEKEVSHFNQKGNCNLELKYLGDKLVQKRVIELGMVNGEEKRIRKITIHSADTSNKTINVYHADNIGFDTAIVVFNIDSSYYFRYRYERDDKGRITKGTEYDAQNGNKNYSFEIYYSMDGLTDSIVHKSRTGQINYTEYNFYNSAGEIDKTTYSDGGSMIFRYTKRDKHGNWTAEEVCHEKDGLLKIMNRRTRIIKYY